jgi:hypothetical protein
MATIFTLRGFMAGLRYDYIPEIFGGEFINPGDTVVPIMYNQMVLDLAEALIGEYIIPATLGVDVWTALDAAAALLDDALTNTAGDKVVVGHDEGALVAVKWLRDYGPTSAVPTADVTFMLVGNPGRKYGGAFYVPGYDVPENTPYTVTDIANQYDPIADWPCDLLSLGASLAVLNALAGAVTCHINYFNSDLNDPGKQELTEGNITYVLLPTYPVPIIEPIPLELIFPNIYDNPIARQIDMILRPIIELAYCRWLVLPPFEYIYTNIVDCADPNHFYVLDGLLTPQPWMQYRHVASKTVPGRAKDFTPSAPSGTGFLQGIPILGSILGGVGLGDVTGILTDPFSGGGGFDLSSLGLGGILGSGSPLSGNKNDLIHYVELSWTNATPLPHWCYGMITRGGCRVTLQARSRAYLAVWSGYGVGADPGDLTLSSTTGCGADMGKAGALSTGTGFCIIEERQNTLTIPLAPERGGWQRLEPGETLTARVEVRFVSDQWEASQIDGGDLETESGYQSGDTQLDLFAVPIFEYEEA